MEALHFTPLTLHRQPQAALSIHDRGISTKSHESSDQGKRALGVVRGGVATGSQADSSFGSRQLQAGCNFSGLRKTREFVECSKSRKCRSVNRYWWESLRQRQSKFYFLPVRAGLSSAPVTNQGLYDPSFDKDGCGVGFIAKLSQEPSRDIVSSYIP